MITGSEEIILCGDPLERTRIAKADCATHPWYVSKNFDADNYKDIRYLHRDGVWRPQTQHQGSYTGLFDTKDDALKAVDRFHEVEGISHKPRRPSLSPPSSPKKKESPPPVEASPPPPPVQTPTDAKIIEANPDWRALDKLQALVNKHESSIHAANKVKGKKT